MEVNIQQFHRTMLQSSSVNISISSSLRGRKQPPTPFYHNGLSRVTPESTKRTVNTEIANTKLQLICSGNENLILVTPEV
uniref:Uncharacterized protein n=1 Tax=Solanum lycopersicum TaxID=4081 RepID=A0A3Q7H500_SOLLC